jgi:SAM-dependent methyltransferase
MAFETIADLDLTGAGGSDAVLTTGWSHAEPTLRWAVGPESAVEFITVAPAPSYRLHVTVSPHNQLPGMREQTLTVLANGHVVETVVVTATSGFDFTIPSSVARLRTPMEIRFQHPNILVPAQHGPSIDDRPLALAFHRCRLLREVEQSTQSATRSATTDTDPLVPPAEMLFDGTTTVEQFKQLGTDFVQIILAGRAGLRPHHRVLDLGSGNGQKARALTTFLNRQGSYEGLDVVAAGVEWCTERYARFPNFRFRHADVYSSHYNPKSTTPDTEYRLPYNDGEFDMVFLTSVFTHMLPDGIDNYINQISRVLKSGGRCVATFFLLNPESNARIINGSSAIRFMEVPGGFRVMDPQNPSQAVAVPEERVRGSLTAAGLRVAEITFGTWSGGPDLLAAYQDLVIAVKP